MIYVYIIIIISSGEVYMIDNPKSQGLEFYKKVKEEIDLEESYCAQPSGEFSTWFGNRYDYKTKLWNGYKGSKIMNTSIELIKDPSSPEEICLTNEFGKFRPRKCGDPTNRFCAFCDKFETNKPIYMKGFCEEFVRRAKLQILLILKRLQSMRNQSECKASFLSEKSVMNNRIEICYDFTEHFSCIEGLLEHYIDNILV